MITRKHAVSVLGAVLALILAGTVFAGWLTDAPELRRVFPNGADAMPLAALMLALLGSGALLAPAPGKRSILRMGAAGTAGLIALLVLGMYVSGAGPSFELALFREPVISAGGMNPGRPSPATAFSVFIVAVGLGLTGLAKPRYRRVGSMAVLLAGVLPWLALFEYVSLTSQFDPLSKDPTSEMSPVVAIGLLAVAVAVIWERPRQGLAGLLSSPTSGGTLLRLGLPVCLFGPLGISWVAVHSELLQPATVGAVLAIDWGVWSILASVFLMWIGIHLDRSHLREVATFEERERLLSRLDRANEMIRGYVASAQRSGESTDSVPPDGAEALEFAPAEGTAKWQDVTELGRKAAWVAEELEGPLAELERLALLAESRESKELNLRTAELLQQALVITEEMQERLRGLLSAPRVRPASKDLGASDPASAS